MDARVHIFTARHKDEVRWLVVRQTAFTPGEIPRCSFYRRLSETVCTRRIEENSPPLRRPGSNPDSPARSQAPCSLSHLAHRRLYYKYNLPFLLKKHSGSRHTPYSRGHRLTFLYNVATSMLWLEIKGGSDQRGQSNKTANSGRFPC